MKKIKLLVLFALLAACVCSAVACDFTIGHTYDDEYTYDEYEHWYECTGEGCGAKKSVTPHKMTDEVYALIEGESYLCSECEVCGYEKKLPADGVTVAVDTATAQAALDNAEEGDTIVLTEGVYATLYIRKNDDSELIESDWAGGGNHTYKRTVKNLTIIGQGNVTVTSIVAEAQTYVPGGNFNSLSTTNPRLNTYIDFQNLAIENINFTPDAGRVAVELASAGQKVSIDGLLIKGCTVNGTGDINSGNRLFQSEIQNTADYTEKGNAVLTAYRRNITVTECEINNLHQGLKINYVENLTVTDNNFSGIKGRDLLITNADGDIIISDNTFDGSTERVLRMNLKGNLTMRGNVVTNWNGTDPEMVKIEAVSGATPTVVLEDNTWMGKTDAEAKTLGTVVYPTV
ncbi:MAG: hypothetical protein IKB51_07560 [Clostridia bacterium]|nr:hypothetical protein [Clostridia bacterium]